MRFEARDLPPHAEPVSAGELVVGNVYFAVQYLDQQRLIPTWEPLVFLGRDLEPEDSGQLYFQDAESHYAGARYEDENSEGAVFYQQASDQIKHIFEFDRALDRLLACGIRRSSG